MKNYKLIDTRPELTTEQVLQGMDFKKIKVSAGIAKAALLKSIIIKSILGVVLISASVVVYQKYKSSPSYKEQVALVETTTKAISKENEPVSAPSYVVIEKEPEKSTNLKAIGSALINKDTIIKDEVVSQSPKKKEEDPLKSTNANDSLPIKEKGNKEKEKLYALSKYAKCKLWKPNSYCDIPKKAKLSNSFDTDAAKFDYISCHEAMKYKMDMKAVWVTISTKGKTDLQLETELKNITLLRSSTGESLHPIMISVMADGIQFFGDKIIVKKFTAHYYGQADFFIFFSEADIGDTVIVKNLIQAVIQE